MSDAAPVLSLRGIVRTYRSGDRQLEVLKSIDLDLFPGELVGLIGPSGSGKSSLLHAAGLLERPTAGQVLIGGQDCTGMSEKARTVLARVTITIRAQSISNSRAVHTDTLVIACNATELMFALHHTPTWGCKRAQNTQNRW